MSTKRRRGALRKVAAVLAVLAVVLVAGFGVAPRVAWAEEATLGVPQHDKTISQNEDGTYTLTLSVTGDTDSTSETVNKPVDIVLVVDQSSSMTDSRLSNVRTAANGLAQSVLADNADGQVRISVITFGEYTQQSGSKTGTVGGTEWYTNASQVMASIPTSAPYSNGTNWEVAMRAAREKLSAARENADKYVIFLSDGEPTFRLGTADDYSDNWFWVFGWVHSENTPAYDRTTGERVGRSRRNDDTFYTSSGRQVDPANVDVILDTGSDDTNDYEKDFNAAVAEAQSIQGATFFTVSADRNADSSMKSFHQSVTGSAEGFYSASDADSLNKAFDDIASIIRSEASYRNVTITDTLSQWVTGVTSDGSPTTDGKVDEGTFTYAKNGQTWDDAPQASVDENGVVTWDLGESTLEKNVTYSVSFNIAVKQSTYDDAANKGEKTTYLTNGPASVSYDVYKTINGEASGEPEHGNAPYDSQTVSVPVSTLSINKVWNGEGAKPDSITVDVYQDGDLYKQGVELKDDGSGVWSTSVVVSAGPEGHTYSLREIKSGDGWTTESIVADDTDSSSAKLTGLDARSAAFTVTNVPESFALWVYKTDTDSTVLHNAKFDLYKAADDGSFDRDDDLIFKSDAIGTEDTDNHAVFEDLQPGTYYLVETYVPAGYQLREDPYKIVVTSEGIQFASSANGDPSPANKVDGQDRTYRVSFVNEKAVTEIPSTGGIGDVPLYAAGVVAVAGSVMAARKIKSN